MEIAEHAVMYLRDNIVSNAINAPRGKLDVDTEPFMPLAERMGTLVQQMVGNRPLKKLEIAYCGELAGKQTKLLTVSALIGYFKNILGSANIINALPVAKSKGIEIAETNNDTAKDYSSIIEIRFTADGESHTIRGTVIGGQPRLVGVDVFSFEVPMYGDMMFLEYKDAPGVIGIVGNTLGSAGINVAQMSVGRSGDRALMFLTVDQPIPDELVQKISADVGSKEIKFLDLVA